MRQSRATRWMERLTETEARIGCYLLGPVPGALMLFARSHGGWAIRFHATHSLLMTAFWSAAWGGLRLLEEVSPWFLGMVVREFRLVVNLTFLAVWVLLLIAAFEGNRGAVVPFVHRLAVKLARRQERKEELEEAGSAAAA